ncbi:MAG: hypothetical protein HYZ28_07080 [Myxococcales bacterium]|nr:hypothetical protein [Myxococcales bacterium]
MGLSAAVCAACALLSAGAHAASKGQRRAAELIKEAGQLYEQGKYRESAELLLKAHEQAPNSKLIYNIARAYDQAGDLEKSLEFYRRYVSMEDADPELLKRANLAMDRLRGLIAKEQAAREQREKERQRLEEESRAAQEKLRGEADAAKRQTEELEAKQRAEAEQRERSRSLGRTLSFISGGVAVAGLGAGAFFGLGAQASKKSFTEASNVDSKKRLEAETRGKALLADVGFGVGVAAAVAAVVLYPKGEPAPAKEVSVTFLPAPSGAGLSVRF